MDRLNIDTLGPFPTDSLGNSYLIVIIDCFSRFVELYPTRDTTAKEAARVLLEHVGRYGLPLQLLSDQGSQYVNQILDEFLHLLDLIDVNRQLPNLYL